MDRRRARAVFRSATPDRVPEVNAAALQWGAALAAGLAVVALAYFIAAWVAATILGPRYLLLPVTVIVVIPCARALHQCNLLRRELRAEEQRVG